MQVICRCGHPRDAHRHYRPGSDCSACTCTKYRPPLTAVLRRVLPR